MHSEDHYIDQSPEALRLTLVDGSIDLTSFHVYSSRSFRCAGLHIEARVIGASHIISYSTDRAQLHEVLACVGPPPQDATSWTGISTHSLSALARPIKHIFDGLEYTFMAHSVPWSDPEPESVTRLLHKCGTEQAEGTFGIAQHFPQGNCAVTPKTIIAGSYRPGLLTIETAHSYPNVRGLVLSRTKIRTGGTK